MNLEIKAMKSTQAKQYITELAHLRIEIFQDYPYLYHGDLEYEEKYLANYLDAPDFLMVIVLEDQRVVGASTALPLIYETSDIQRPFEDSEFEKEQILYLAESVLLPSYRGQGIGHQFFDHREAHAQRLGFSMTTFCAVQRVADHSMKPASYRTHHHFWQTRGYTEYPNLQTELSWQDVGEQEETAKTMRFWLK